mmetsp:Transcript_14254/g.24292  ORF Transcript_14254/g.24292 Transcript_14254/m.24292 type:complete len:236 (-) Transcript_14254:96-803(-)|eukprot:CAMPEP_0206176920 /NCGR_PEP_ID=MMETSP1474-20131121/59558_1 /ASSEMBLY_ACC=CAM_ASM_001110 /TAXON_ID=97495 /ORGANISM="Imantonia sp., Strain RCC918" /LENGTH=235 /DNA_ID=CAMNT_0053588321 /DNA_START=40 /DNA_END=747 /DNA_ORIENTATION=+
MSDEDEFKSRDAQGLQPRKKDGPMDDEAAAAKAQAMYMKMIFAVVPTVQVVLATLTYLLASLGLGMKASLDAKFAFLHAYDLGYVYLAVYLIGLGRARLTVNSNAMRAGARLDRPDQHVYKIMDPAGKKDAPYVLMANVGWAGKFNRAQRGAFNTDEALPMVLVNTVLAGGVFGPIVVATALLGVYGRVKFALGYTEKPAARMGGFLPAALGEGWAAGLVLFTAIKAIGGGYVPF